MGAIIKRIRSGQRIEHYETVRLRKDGGRLTSRLSVSPVKNVDVKLSVHQKSLETSRRRKRAEEAAHRTEQEFRDSWKTPGVGMHWLGRMESFSGPIAPNGHARLHAGKNTLGRHIADFMRTSRWLKAILQRLTDRETLPQLRGASAVQRWLIPQRAHQFQRFVDGDKFVHTAASLRDVTEHKQREAQIACSLARPSNLPRNVLATRAATVLSRSPTRLEGLKHAIEGRIQAARERATGCSWNRAGTGAEIQSFCSWDELEAYSQT